MDSVKRLHTSSPYAGSPSAGEYDGIRLGTFATHDEWRVDMTKPHPDEPAEGPDNIPDDDDSGELDASVDRLVTSGEGEQDKPQSGTVE